ncbi:aldehyde dehydrogenase family protein [Streptomyces sp. H27-S2]|uniref:aldehyde dehydrogenase family protein n=1 Tax=Streptomyces antarcticus TaxID=2996458 RepID=UPI00226F1A2A|nr:aldehyde dehydrogenase family protein [Streptomyces sp. H27-S2]MCY0950416.1 aldehyde dehydrogenase family protein [Streptomyces sp. H27-S2]
MTIRMTVAGARVDTAGRLPVENPATGAVIAEAPDCTLAQLDEAVAAAAAAQPRWTALTEDERRAHLVECGKRLGAAGDEVARLLSAEQGKPVRDALGEVGLSAAWFGHTAELSLSAEQLVRDSSADITLTREPYGVVAAIAPSNFPIILAMCKVAPALLAGNTVVLKPSPQTPLSTLRVGEVLQECLPPGVLNVVSGADALGEALTTHPGIRLISFTGSVGTGRGIARHAAGRFTPVVLELGGNDPAIVLPDADVDALAPALFGAALANSGQFCAAVKRVYVPEEKRERLAGLLADLARRAVVGDGADPATEYGPLISRAQRDRVASLVDAAVKAGARVVTGGVVPEGPGHFYPPTVVTDLPAGTALEVEEQFGPVIPVLGYADVDEAVARANATEFGLGASLWGDERQARALAGRLDCGTVWINTHGDLRHNVPFGGTKSSGVGVEYGHLGLLAYTRPKVLNVADPRE